MIPKIIHYCWFGQKEMPQMVKECISSWHKYMPDWEYRLWNEDTILATLHSPLSTFDSFEDALKESNQYAFEAYKAKKYAFVSDYVRLWALERFGGLYLDTDVEVFRSFEPLMANTAFAGFEGSKNLPMGTCVMATMPHGEWVTEQLKNYENRHFINPDGTFNMLTNVQFISGMMSTNGFVQNGAEQDYKDLHVFPVDYFSPRLTTGEYIRTENTYCEHKGLGSWSGHRCSWKRLLKCLIGQKNMTRLIKFKRKNLE